MSVAPYPPRTLRRERRPFGALFGTAAGWVAVILVAFTAAIVTSWPAAAGSTTLDCAAGSAAAVCEESLAPPLAVEPVLADVGPPVQEQEAADGDVPAPAAGGVDGAASGAAVFPAAAKPRAPGPLVALTFDAGADRGYAEYILDVLAAEQVPASFGITGAWARANPQLVVRIGAEGHLLINHTVSHRSFTGFSDRLGGLSPVRRRAELEEADEILAPLIGRSTRPWYRLPYGDDDARVVADVAPAGYTRKAGWTVDSLGWRGLPTAEIIARCLRLAAPGAVYLLHVGAASRDGPALTAIIAGLRERGFGFATMEDLGPA